MDLPISLGNTYQAEKCHERTRMFLTDAQRINPADKECQFA